jgi:plasmid replication initiation protein
MDNKNSTQVTLPFDFKGKDIDYYARQHWNVTFSRQGKVGVLSKKIMSAVISQIKRDDADFKPVYQFHVTDFLTEEETGTKIYSAVKRSFIELSNLNWLIEDLENKKFAVRHLLNTSDVRCGYDNGTITIVLNPILKPYFIALSHYTTYDLKWYMTFKSWYSMRLFELLSAKKDTGLWVVTIEDYRKLMDCEGKYKEAKSLIIKTTAEPLLELERTDMAFTFEEITEKVRGAKGRPPIVALKFKLKKVQLKKIPSDVDIPAHTQKIIERLKNRYQVSEANIVKYLKAIGTSEARNLLNSWDIKEASADPIKNKLFYCNKVFVALGKKALGE